MMENPKNLNAHLPANMQSAVKRILPAKPIVKPIASGEPPVAPESIKSKDLEDKSDIESVASSYTTGSEQTVTPSSSDNVSQIISIVSIFGGKMFLQNFDLSHKILLLVVR